jgi:hypothetical protein
LIVEQDPESRKLAKGAVSVEAKARNRSRAAVTLKPNIDAYQRCMTCIN